MLWLHTQEDPPQAQWEAGLKRVVAAKEKVKGDLSRFRALAVSDGGAPNSLQRKQIFVDVFESSVKAAVVTKVLADRLKRGIVTAISWINPTFRGFQPEQFDQALAHLDLQQFRSELMVELKRLQDGIVHVESLSQILAQRVS